MISYSVEHLPIKTIVQKYENWTFPSLSFKLKTRELNDPLIAILAMESDKMVGLLLAEYIIEQNGVKVISLLVHPENRKRGIGTGLLQKLENWASEKGFWRIDLVFQSNWELSEALTRALAKCHWEDPVRRMILCYANIKNYEGAPWLSYDQIPPKFEIFNWSDLTGDDKNLIMNQRVAGSVTPDVDPFQAAEKCLPELSVGLRHQGQLVGWMITHKVSNETLQRTCVYLDPEFRKNNLALALSANVIKLQLKSDYPKAIFQIHTGKQKMISYFEKFLKEYQDTIVDIFWSTKNLRK